MPRPPLHHGPPAHSWRAAIAPGTPAGSRAPVRSPARCGRAPRRWRGRASCPRSGRCQRPKWQLALQQAPPRGLPAHPAGPEQPGRAQPGPARGPAPPRAAAHPSGRGRSPPAWSRATGAPRVA
eukprot:6111437-Alexandrium_andersonii.AAC.1